mgnify:CR=1 FL=1
MSCKGQEHKNTTQKKGTLIPPKKSMYYIPNVNPDFETFDFEKTREETLKIPSKAAALKNSEAKERGYSYEGKLDENRSIHRSFFEIIDKNKKFSRVYTEAKMLLPDKNIDVGFYEIDLIRDTEWKVFALRETMPKVNVGVPKSNLQELISDTYREYFEKISQNDSSCLAGPARTAFEKQPQKIALTGTISNLQTEIIFSGSKLEIVPVKAIF